MHVKRRFLGLLTAVLVSISLSGCDFLDQISDFIGDFLGRSISINPQTGPIPGYKPYQRLPASLRSLDARDRQLPKMARAGSEVFIRIFKQERQLEVWLRGEDEDSFVLFKSYRICNFSGGLGPKLKEGDKQSPEGFYEVRPTSLNPNSAYHLSFNLGFPNKLERSLGRTGSYLMVHGNCLSVGCYAMTDARIEQIYTLVYEAFGQGQRQVQVHAFPFHLTDENLQKHTDSIWYSFWKNMQKGYQIFEDTKVPPIISVAGKDYIITQG